MSVVKVGENESLESALKRFKRKCQKDNILGELRKKEFYEKPSVRRKKKSEAARKRGNKADNKPAWNPAKMFLCGILSFPIYRASIV